MTGSIPPPGPLAYEGQVVVPFIHRTFSPQSTFNQFPVPTIWINTSISQAWILVSKALGVAVWAPIGGAPGEIDTITTPDMTVVVPTAGNINFLNGTGMNITGSGSSITFSLTGAVADLFTADSGTATPSSNNLIITGSSTGLTTTGSGNTIGLTGTLNVAHGGTGDTSFTAYSLIAGGTTSTGPLQNAGTGSAGQWYVSNGSSSLGTFKSLKVQTQVFTINGTYTPTSGMIYCKIECLGGGGAGGGAAATGGGNFSAGAGGGGGEYALGIFTAAQIGASKSVTIGAGGTANSGASGGNGGNTSVGSTLISANGGIGGVTIGATAVPSSQNGSLGGSGGTGGDLRTPGSPGGYALCVFSAAFAFGGPGGGSQYGAGGVGGFGQGSAGLGYGSGGSGSQNAASLSAIAGGNGAPGIVYITEYVIS